MIVFLVGSQQSRVLLISYFMQRSLHFFQRIFLREIIVGVVHALYIVCGGRHQNDYFIGILYFQLRSVHYRNLSSFILHDQLLKGMDENTNSEQENQYLEMLYFQFGRYLLISSSREGSLPANLQGVWGERLSNPWNADYHTNINIQMNYWPTQSTNLSPCHLPLVEYVRSLVPREEDIKR